LNEPKISVIIPLYNAEKFIRQTLISVLASKFQDYEVLVVDDCSTDNSIAEVKKLLPHFGGRLKILSTEKNSGGAGVPRNVGIKNAAGKYFTTVDSDDFILPTALGDFFDVAEKFQADVVHMEKSFSFNDTGKATFRREDLILQKYEAGECVEEPTPEPEDLRERTRRLFEGRFIWITLGKFYRREFVVKNKIEFLNLPIAEDLFFWFKSFCLAEKYIRAPQVTNIYRRGHSSASNKIISSDKGVKLWLNILTKNISAIYKLTGEMEFFKANSSTRRDVLKFFVDKHFAMIKNLFQGLGAHEVQKIFFDELQNPALNSDGKNLVAAYLFTEKIL